MGLEKDYQEVTLESGEKIKTRHLRTLDYTFIGQMSDPVQAEFIKMSGRKTVEIKDLTQDSAEYIVKACMRGIVKHPEKFTITAKQPVDCDDNEYSFYDLSEVDQALIMSSIFSGGVGVPVQFPEKTSG